MTTYTVRADRGDGRWIVTVAELHGLTTSTKRLDRVEDLARATIARLLDVDPDSFGVTVSSHIGSLDAEIARAIELRARTAEARRQATIAYLSVARALADEGLTVRDIGQILGLSYQRAHQLLG
jgi:hypothetical protein